MQSQTPRRRHDVSRALSLGIALAIAWIVPPAMAAEPAPTQPPAVGAPPNPPSLISPGVINPGVVNPALINPGVVPPNLVNPGLFGALPQHGGEVHGSIFAESRSVLSITGAVAKVPEQVMLPDVSVTLRNVATSAETTPVTTDLFGAFRIPMQLQGEYKLCWKAEGFIANCQSDSFVLRGVNINLRPVGIIPDPGTITGTVTLKGGRPCRFNQGFLGAETVGSVTAAPAGGAARTVRVNNYNQYMIGGVPNGAVQLTAACEAAKATQAVTLAGSATEDFTLPNSPPVVGAFYATESGHAVTAAAAGTTVHATIEAKDGGGYPLHYRWATDPKVPGFVSPDAPSADVKVAGPGMFSIYVLIHDGNGGNAMRKLSLTTSPDKILFSGHVRSNVAAAVPQAKVTLNGHVTTTTAAGDFEVILPKEDPRYVLTIEKPGLQMVSKVFYAPVKGGNYLMYEAQVQSFAAGQAITFIERPTKGRDQAGVEVTIPAGSLVLDGTKTPATGAGTFQAASYNLADGNNPLPGDFAGLDSGGKASRLQTYGSADIAITNSSGQKLNLAPGKTAAIKMPIDAALLASAPPTIPVWHYDPTQGAWIRDGSATRNGGFYEATVTHFSAVNMDLAFSDGACTRIVVDQSIMPTPFKIRMTPLSGPAVRPDHQDQIVDGPLSVVVREPPNIDVQYDMIDSNGNVIAAAKQTVHTGASSPSGTMWNPPPNPPYADCTSEVDYNENTVQPLFPTNSANDFLTYLTPSGDISGATADSLTDDYYHRIDPSGTKTAAGDVNDFAHWKTANGFDRPGEVNTKYENNYDLGFGRDMHMQTGGQTGTCANCIAYYVTNYPTVEDTVSNPGAALATVAMEYSPQNGTSGTPYTKFYVYGANGAINRSADLDTNGQKNVPSLCIICHNGNITTMGADGSMPFSRFIAFDLDSYNYHPTNPTWFRAAQEASFKQMNHGVLTQTNASAPLRTLITQWYGAVGDVTLPGTFNGSAVPDAWVNPAPDHSGLYNAVVKPSCRSCHTTRDPADTGQDIAWDTYDSFNNDGVIRFLTCSPSSHAHAVMPQAKRTFARFWLSTTPNGPATLGASGIGGFAPPNNSCTP